MKCFPYRRRPKRSPDAAVSFFCLLYFGPPAPLPPQQTLRAPTSCIFAFLWEREVKLFWRRRRCRRRRRPRLKRADIQAATSAAAAVIYYVAARSTRAMSNVRIHFMKMNVVWARPAAAVVAGSYTASRVRAVTRIAMTTASGVAAGGGNGVIYYNQSPTESKTGRGLAASDNPSFAFTSEDSIRYRYWLMSGCTRVSMEHHVVAKRAVESDTNNKKNNANNNINSLLRQRIRNARFYDVDASIERIRGCFTW